MITIAGISIPIQDTIALAIGLIGALLAWAQSTTRLPKWARKWLSKIGTDEVFSAIEYAERIADLTPDQRRAEAVAYLVRLSKNKLGFPVPDSIANLLVEFVYQQWKRRK